MLTRTYYLVIACVTSIDEHDGLSSHVTSSARHHPVGVTRS